MPVLSGSLMMPNLQRKALCLCLDAYETSGREALEVKQGINFFILEDRNYQSEKVKDNMQKL